MEYRLESFCRAEKERYNIIQASGKDPTLFVLDLARAMGPWHIGSPDWLESMTL